MKEKLLLIVLVFYFCMHLSAQDIIISEKKDSGFFPIVSALGPTAIYVDEKDHWLMHKTAELLQQDLEMVTGQKTEIISTLPLSADNIIIIGSQDGSIT